MEDQNPVLPAPAAGLGEFRVYESPTPRFTLPDGNGHPGVVTVPFGDSDQEVGTRALEYGKLALYRMGMSPNLHRESLHMGIHPAFFDAALENMAARHMSDTNNSVVEYRRLSDPNHKGLKSGTWQQAAFDLANYDRYPSKEDILPLVASQLEQANTLYRTDDPRKADQSVLTALKILQDYYDAKQLQKHPPPGRPGDGGGSRERLGEDPDDKAFEWGKNIMGYGSYRAPNQWGKLTIQNPTRTKRYTKALRAMRPRPGFFGGFRYPHRALIPSGDGMAFGSKRKRRGGSMLVDCSGSMSISQADIERLLDMAPAFTVALYGGKGTTGKLVIIIRMGRGVFDVDTSDIGGGNVVDGPALQWLSQEQGPRIWISDGLVTGLHDRPAPNLVYEAEIIRLKGRIKRYEDIDTFLDEYSKKVIRL